MAWDVCCVTCDNNLLQKLKESLSVTLRVNLKNKLSMQEDLRKYKMQLSS